MCGELVWSCQDAFTFARKVICLLKECADGYACNKDLTVSVSIGLSMAIKSLNIKYPMVEFC